ncbi:ctp synthase [Vairimorpha apis BRL 01]|uniref:CTP synthase n=1 Tax=Vairimorpha apis BRL 01 TaxID=1037528 RepID=T0MAI7_9MICR|nr:ctp synthase [Vairimorpha apis BRL 01]
MKYIIISGGVISGIGKGITASSIGTILKSKGYNVSHIKIDPYLNYSAGMMAPSEHGEVYVLSDGTETDLDLGNYERFSGLQFSEKNAITSGKIYYNVIKQEMKGLFNGKTLQINPHCVNEILNRINDVCETEIFDEYKNKMTKADIVVIELGGTVGDNESIMYLEAFYKFFKNIKHEDFLFISVDFLVELHNFEHKTKPLQVSARKLRSYGLKTDIIICRTQMNLASEIIEKLADKCNVDSDSIFHLPNLKSVYKVPQFLLNNNLFECLKKKLNLKDRMHNTEILDKFETLVKRHNETIIIGIVAKYGSKGDAYASIIHAILFSSAEVGVNIEISWIDAEKLEEKDELELKKLDKSQGIIIPGGFGIRGIEGKIIAIEYCRINNKPLLGICLGLQLSVIEFARNVLNYKNATSEEFDSKSGMHFISLLDLNGVQSKSLRLGENNIILTKKSKITSIYGKNIVSERHRHRYGINKKYIDLLEENGFVCSGRSECENVAEIFELKNHNFFIGVQYHPEFNAKPLNPSPLFSAFIKASFK